MITQAQKDEMFKLSAEGHSLETFPGALQGDLKITAREILEEAKKDPQFKDFLDECIAAQMFYWETETMVLLKEFEVDSKRLGICQWFLNKLYTHTMPKSTRATFLNDAKSKDKDDKFMTDASEDEMSTIESILKSTTESNLEG